MDEANIHGSGRRAGRGRGRHRFHHQDSGYGFAGPPFGGHRGRHRARKARRGDIRMAALLLLAEEPRNGYQIMKEIEERSEGVWRPSPGSVYPILQQLEDEGLVQSKESEGQRLIELTETGRAEIAGRGKDAPAPWVEMATASGEHTLELGSLVRQIGLATMQVGQVGTDAQIEEARKILTDSRRSLYRILAEDDKKS